MAKVYTAAKLREAASMLDGDVCVTDRGELSAMLRQAADAMEREEKRKRLSTIDYSFVHGGWRDMLMFDSLAQAKMRAAQLGYEVEYFVSREVGEWKEVRDGE